MPAENSFSHTSNHAQTTGGNGHLGSAHVRAMGEDYGTDAAYRAARDRLDFSESIARELIGLRMQHRLSQAELARRVGTTASVISRLERGNHLPSTETLRKIAAATGTRLVIHFALSRRKASPRSQGAASRYAEDTGARRSDSVPADPQLVTAV